MHKYILLSLIMTVSLASCTHHNTPIHHEEHYHAKVVALEKSLAHLYLLCDNNLVGVSSDCTDISKACVIGGVISPSSEAILSLSPDLVLFSKHIAQQQSVCDTLQKAGIMCLSFELNSFDNYLSSLKLLCDTLGTPAAYQTYGEAVKEQVNDIVQQARDKSQNKPVHLLLLRASSANVKVKASSNMLGAMLADLAAINIADKSISEDLSIEAVLTDEPDMIVAELMGNATSAQSNLEYTIAHSPLKDLSCVKSGRVYPLSQELFHFCPCEKYATAYQTLFDILYS